LLGLVVAAAWLLAGPLARAEGSDFAAAVSALAAPSGDAVARAAQAIGASGDPRALGLLEALRDGSVVIVDHAKVGVRDGKGVWHDAVTGEAVEGAGSPPTMDNEVRRALDPIIARLELDAPAPEVRLAAVATLANRSN
jgi:urea transport system permease protein